MMKYLQRLLSAALCAALLCGSFGMARATAPEVPAEPSEEEEVLAVLAGTWDTADPFLAQTDLANLIHEAQLWATGAQVSILPTAAVVASEEDAPAADTVLHPSDCTRLYPREEILYTIELTGLQLKDWLETVAGRYILSEDGTISAEGEGIDQIYGISYEIFLGNPTEMRVGNITCQGKRLSTSETYQVAVGGSRLAAAGQEDPWGWYAATGISQDSPKVLWSAADSEQFGEAGGTVSAVLEQYIRFLTREENEVTPPVARSHWRLYNTTSEVALRPVTRLQFVETLYKAAGSPAVEMGTLSFTDMAEPNPAAFWAVKVGIVAGNGAGQFLPDTPITREQTLVMLLRYDISRQAGPQGAWMVALPYTDAATSSGWAAEALMWNVRQGYLLPDDGGNLNPQATLTATQLEEALRHLGTEKGATRELGLE